MKQIRNLILVGMMSCLSLTSFAESKEKNSERTPAQVNPNQAIELMGTFNNGARVERLHTGARTSTFFYQIIDEKEKIVCYASSASNNLSCLPRQ